MNKNSVRKTAAALSVLTILASSFCSSGAFSADAHTYESLGVDRTEKDSFEEKISAQTKLPVINVTTTNNNEMILSKEIYTDCVIDVFNVSDEYELDEASAGIRVRGNSSAYYGDVNQIMNNPVPYRIKFDKKTNMLGLNNGAECKSWVLLKSDWDLIRNDIALRMGRTLFGDTAYVSDSQFVHLYVNDEFQGIYVLCEQNQVNENRVNITEPEEDYTGTDFGWYLELNNYATRLNADGSRYDDDPYITMDYEEATVTDITGETRQFVPAEYSIKNDVYTQEQIDFIDKYLNNVFEILYKAVEEGEYLTFDANFDLVESEYTNAEETVTAIMDIDSVVDMYLLYEIVHDYDCGEGSFYMCVDFAENSECPKLQFTSPWDFNWAYNDSASRYWAGAFCEKWFANQNGDRSNPWFILLAKEEWFQNLCIQEWTADAEAVKAAIQEERDILAEYPEDLTKTSENAINDANTLLEWIDQRIVWMDKTFTANTANTDDITNSGVQPGADTKEGNADSSDSESDVSNENNGSDDTNSVSDVQEEASSSEKNSTAQSKSAVSDNPNTGKAGITLSFCALAGAIIAVIKKNRN